MKIVDIEVILKEKGFTSLKFGGGILGDNPIIDYELVKVVREELGDDFEYLW